MRLVFVVQFLSDEGHLAALEVSDPDRPPTFGGTDHGSEHQLENRLFAEGVGNDLQPPALLDEQTFQQIRRSDGAAMRDRHPQVRDASLEVVHEAGDGARQLGLVLLDQTFG